MLQCTAIAMKLTDRLNRQNYYLNFTSSLGNYSIVYFYGLFWGEQQPFASSGCGGLYFLRRCIADRTSDP